MIKTKYISVRDAMIGLNSQQWCPTHYFDKYPAKMIPQLARFAIEKCTIPGQIILDPFCGCGTVLIESIVSGRRATGFDINPYAVVLAHAKSHFYQGTVLKDMLTEVAEHAESISKVIRKENSWLNYWFTDTTLRQLLGLRQAIDCFKDKITPSYLCALHAILGVTIRLVCRADPRSPKPFISERARRKRIGRHFNALKEFCNQGQRFIDYSEKFKNLAPPKKRSRITVMCGDARKLEQNNELGKFDAIISSPPYLTAQDYYRSSKLEIYIMGLMGQSDLEGLGASMIGSGRGKTSVDILKKVEYYPKELSKLTKIDERSGRVCASFIADMHKVLKGCYKLLVHRGRCCLIIGDSKIRGISLPVHRWITKMARDQNFNLDDHFIDTIKNRRVPPQRAGHSSVIKCEHILIFSKR